MSSIPTAQPPQAGDPTNLPVSPDPHGSRRIWWLLAFGVAGLVVGAVLWQARPSTTNSPIESPGRVSPVAAAATEPTAVRTPDLATPEAVAIDLTPVVAVTAAAPGTVEPYTSGGPRLDTAGWSPNGRWFAYWVAGMDVPYQRDVWPSSLHFLDAERGTTCQQSNVSSTMYGDDAFWEPDSRVAIRLGGGVQLGEPCGPLSPDPESTLALPLPSPGVIPDWAVPDVGHNDAPGPEDTKRSPSEEYFVTTVAEGAEDRYTTRLMRRSDGAVLTEATWQSNGGIGDMGTGGEWTADDQFLIFYSMDQGPILLQPDGTVLNVASDVFGLDLDAVTTQYEKLGQLHSTLALDRKHVLLERPGNPVMLHHPETGASETLPTEGLMQPWFSPNLSWLFVNGLLKDGKEDPGVWMRPIDGTNAEFQRLPGDRRGRTAADYFPSPNGAYLAILGFSNTVEIVSFPDLKSVGRWRWKDADQVFVKWSPTEKQLILDGYAYADPSQVSARSLFLITLPTTPPTAPTP